VIWQAGSDVLALCPVNLQGSWEGECDHVAVYVRRGQVEVVTLWLSMEEDDAGDSYKAMPSHRAASAVDRLAGTGADSDQEDPQLLGEGPGGASPQHVARKKWSFKDLVKRAVVRKATSSPAPAAQQVFSLSPAVAAVIDRTPTAFVSRPNALWTAEDLPPPAEASAAQPTSPARAPQEDGQWCTQVEKLVAVEAGHARRVERWRRRFPQAHSQLYSTLGEDAIHRARGSATGRRKVAMGPEWCTQRGVAVRTDIGALLCVGTRYSGGWISVQRDGPVVVVRKDAQIPVFEPAVLLEFPRPQTRLEFTPPPRCRGEM